ncbi:MAG: quinone oxidoreductase [Endomicrobiales bacterium]|jgi:NADPH2:quinone reductase
MINSVSKVMIFRAGGPEVLTFEKVVKQIPGNGEVWVDQTAIGVNYLDIEQRNGVMPTPLPSGLGYEAAGQVTAVGHGVTEVRVGDRVAYAGGTPSAYTSGRLYPANRLVRLPDNISDVEAAAVLFKGITAQYLIKSTYRVGKETRMLVYGAAGGVGQIMAGWAKFLGARVIGVVSKNQSEVARAAGCTDVLVWGEVDIAAEVSRITDGKKADVVYDSIGRDTFETSLNSLRKRGTFVLFGDSSGAPDPFELDTLNRKGSLYLTCPSIFHYIADQDEYHDRAGDVLAAVAKGIIKPPLWNVYPFAEAAKAHAAIEARQTSGAVVLKVK